MADFLSTNFNFNLIEKELQWVAK